MKVDQNEFLRQAVIRICGSLDIEVAMKLCLEYIKDFLPAESMGLTISMPELKALRVIASASLRDNEKGLGKVIPIEGTDWLLEKSEHFGMEGIRIINHPELIPEVCALMKKTGQGLDFSLMLMRLESEGNLVGEVTVRTKGVGKFSDDHAKLFKMLHEPFTIAMANALKHQELVRLKDILADDSRYFQRQLRVLSGTDIVGADFGLREVMNMVRQVASLDSPVLLLGETGVGKEVLADALHNYSSRREGPLIKVNCGAIPDTLMDSELFGHEKGAFTGAGRLKRGRFERANGGTIFLDEIGDLPSQAQVRLLHVIQNHRIERVGGSQSISVDIRIISATHRNLEQMVAEGTFREDLWFRLNVFPIMVPPLRQRKEDIPALAHHFLERKSLDLKLKERPRLAPGALDQLLAYNWPGNIRELENLVERALIQQRGRAIAFDHMLTPFSAKAAERDGERANQPVLPLDELIARHIRRALQVAKGKVSGAKGAAQLLGMHPNTLRKKMDKLGIPYGKKARN